MEYFIWIIVSGLTGVGYAYVLYSAKAPWNSKLNYTLAVFRFLLVAGITYLILSPFFTQQITRTEKPVVVFAIDNSASIKQTEGIKKVISSLADESEKLASNDIDVKYSLLKEGVNSIDENIPLSETRTDLSGMLNEIKNKYEGRNLASVVLVSDGIYNSGYSPLYENYNFNIHTVGVGDTLIRKDLILNNINYNKITSLNSRAPVVAEVRNIGFQANDVTVNIKEDGKVISKKVIKPGNENGVTKVEFLLDATVKGLHHYVIDILPLKGEFTLKNNTSHIYIDVLDARQKILLAAGGMHPDLKALMAVIEKNQNFELDIFIPGINESKDTKYDLVIFHQIPNLQHSGAELLDKVMKLETPVMFILGNQSDLNRFNNLGIQFKISASGNQQDKVTPELNANFSKFSVGDIAKVSLKDFSPLTVPFGVYDLPGWDVILFQRVGSTVINKPLLAVQTNGKRNLGCLSGEGIWQWRMNEFAVNDNTALFDELFVKVIQLLAKKEDKSRFRCSPSASQFDVNDKVIFNIETYNEIFEKVFGNVITLRLKNEKSKVSEYSIINSENNSSFEISGLPQGIYKYEAVTTISGKMEKVKGEFSITLVDLESLNTTADLELMRQIAVKNNGYFFTPDKINSLSERLLLKKPKGAIYSTESVLEIINWKWLFFMFILLASIEWTSRKYSGGY